MYQKWFLLVSVLVLSAKLCTGQVLQFGTCGDVPPMQFFDLERFLGEWYEIERFPHWYERYGECAYLRFQYCERRVEIEHIYVRTGVRFILQQNSSYAPGDEAIFMIDSSNIDPIGIPMSVLNTDYSNYAVVYGCKYNENLDIKYLSAWILSRTSDLSEEMLQRAYQVLNSIPYANIAYLEKVEQRTNLCKFHWTAVIAAENITDTMRTQTISDDGVLALL
ncbi:unnamed protein product [Arctia plantaginis]|uniref:Lipocalin/cytosolic fatty-acid binding domain-containing protein n=1 Tax=Arctia plantaginis TaxID=874455 RepID=A0A8S1AVV7_ARCPL|nr:unnamed protein product [Arctia plantaginis]CAB3249412.1 unnamed protein product [Arctia plantaginis]